MRATRVCWLRPSTACIAVVLFGACSQSAGESGRTAAARYADAIYHNGRIYTVDEKTPWAEALAVKDGMLVAVDSDETVLQLQGPETALTNLQGRMVIPGIHDTHAHPMEAGIGRQLECRFLSNNLEEVLQILERCLEGVPEGRWLRGGQWNEGLFSAEQLPKRILDDVAPDHPVFLMDWSVHNAWVNSRALNALGIDDDTPDPAGGEIVRDPATGEATGILLDNAAYGFRRRLPAYSLDDRSAALSWSIRELAKHGVTTFRDALTTTATMEAYAELAASDALPINVKTSLSWKSAWANSHAEELALIANRGEFVSPKLDTGFAKIMLDGIPPTYTAALLEPYAPNDRFGPNYRGKLMHAPAVLAADVTRLDRQGITVKIHATGDRSLRTALDAIEAARAANGDSGLIHEVSHAEMIHPDDLPRFSELNAAAEMCPILWYPIPGLDWARWLGEARARVWPIRSLVESGALVIYGSDWPVVPTPNPWPGIEAMVTRSDPGGDGGTPDWPEQAIDLDTTLRIFTINGAVANRVGDRSGSLVAGKDADFIVLDRNIFEVEITDVGETRIVMSVVAGDTVAEIAATYEAGQ